MRSASLESRRMQKEWRHFIQRVDYTSSSARRAFKKASAPWQNESELLSWVLPTRFEMVIGISERLGGATSWHPAQHPAATAITTAKETLPQPCRPHNYSFCDAERAGHNRYMEGAPHGMQRTWHVCGACCCGPRSHWGDGGAAAVMACGCIACHDPKQHAIT